MKQVIGIGNALVDALYRVENDAVLAALHLPKGAMTLIDAESFRNISRRMEGVEVERATGGSACNTVLSLAALGAHPAVIGRLGRDGNGEFFADYFRQKGARTFVVASSAEEPTGVASTFITPDGQRTFGTFLGAAAGLRALDIRPEWFEGFGYLYIEGYLVQNHELIDTAVDMARERGLEVCLDMASYNIVAADREFFAHLLRKTDIVFANEDEARAFTGKEPRQALDDLANVCRTAVVKVGAKGEMARRGEEFAEMPAEKVANVLDTTAAGDFFAAGFLYALASGSRLEACLKAGGMLAAEVIQVAGTKISDDTWQSIRQKMAELV